MNIRRGLWRLWLVATVLWVALALLAGDYSCFYRHGPWCDFWTSETYFQHALGIAGPPVAALVLGIAAIWIGAGFKTQR